jgi:2-dehydro-3-deoxygalactonokinase
LASAEWIAVDWGTSNVRAWGIAADGTTAFERESPQGMGRLERGDYPQVLEALVGDAAGPGQTDVLVCGMAGARTGWREAPYVEAPAELGHLLAAAVSPDAADRFSVRILPGVCQRTAGAEDVMRGEETQLLGFLGTRPDFAGTVVMPGTHSKWVRLAGGRLEHFATAMTGELFDVLGHHSVLRLSLAGEQMGPATEEGISAGMEAGLASPEMLTGLLFRTRAASLLAGKEPDWCAGYLSGLLVGAEVGGHRQWLGTQAVPLIGAARLCRLYGAALARIGVKSEIVEARDATLRGLAAARRQGHA